MDHRAAADARTNRGSRQLADIKQVGSTSSQDTGDAGTGGATALLNQLQDRSARGTALVQYEIWIPDANVESQFRKPSGGWFR